MHLCNATAGCPPSGPNCLAWRKCWPRSPFRSERVIYSFTPDRLDPDARPEPVPMEEGVMQVRGAADTKRTETGQTEAHGHRLGAKCSGGR